MFLFCSCQEDLIPGKCLKLAVDAGPAAAWYQDSVFQTLTCKRLQIDEIWGFVGAKQKNVPNMKRMGANAGDAWLWLATDAETKLVPCWHVGRRDGDSAMQFIDDLASRLALVGVILSFDRRTVRSGRLERPERI
jgi:hypothetical protein